MKTGQKLNAGKLFNIDKWQRPQKKEPIKYA